MPRRQPPSVWLTRCGGTPDGHCLPPYDLIWGITAVLLWHEFVAGLPQVCLFWQTSAGMQSVRQRSWL